MHYSRFGQTSMKVSHLCLGTMGFGGEQMPAAACARVLDEAVDNGINFVDTAEGYGASEALLGEILGSKRDRLFLSTKVFTLHTHQDACGRNSRHNILRSCDDSLARLQTDYIDLYLLHHPDPETPIQETVDALAELVQSGKVRYVGCSNHYAWQVALMLGVAAVRGGPAVVTNQVCYNLLDRPLELELAALARCCALPLMAYSPLCGGLLTGKYKRGVALPPGSGIENRFGGKIRKLHQNEVVQDVLDGLREIAAAVGVSVLQLSLLWLMAKPHVGTVIVGGTRPEHFQPAYAIADRALSGEVVAQLDQLSAPQIYKPFRNQGFGDAPAAPICIH